MNRRTLLGIAAACLACLPASPQQAGSGPAVYTIEVVVFRGGTSTGGEDLAAGGFQRDSTDTGGAELGPSRLLQVLPASRRRLNDVAARLNASGRYRTIAHAAWQQTASAWNSRSGLAAEQVGLGANGLSGTAFLERGQYLHLGFDLTYRGDGSFHLAEMRRVRLNERQYYDHPAFGVIALVTQVAAP